MFKKELKIFLVILVILSILMHYEEFLTHPISHILALQNSGAYGLGIYHPLIFTFLVYIVFLIPRVFFKILKRGNNE